MTTKRHMGTLERNSSGEPGQRIFVCIPMTGLLRAEWVMARYGQVMPCNWSATDFNVWIDQYSPLNYSVADARNLGVHKFLESKAKWLFFLDHDVILSPGALLLLNEYIMAENIPIVNGLYFTKSKPAEPLVYRGRGNSYFGDWKLGDRVWADGAGMGCTLIHRSIIECAAAESEDYKIGHTSVRRVFTTPAGMFVNRETMSVSYLSGTEDLFFYDKLKSLQIYKKAGWSKFQVKKNPLLIDTRLFCRHIDWSGNQYPSNSDLVEFLKGAPKRVTEGLRW